jgi:hypothetical protein
MRQVEVYDGGEAYDPGYLRRREPSTSILDAGLSRLIESLSAIPGQVWLGLLLTGALLALEALSFSASRYGLLDLLGDVRFMNWRWATILAFALCAIDFAGLAYLFTLDQSRLVGREVLYLLAVWMIGAIMNALLTWWAISAFLLKMGLGQEPAGDSGMLTIVPVFAAIALWVTRILLIGALSTRTNRHLYGGE